VARFETTAREIERLLPTLRRFALALTRNRVEADDLVQDCVVRALDRWQQQRADGSLRAWLLTILHNRFISLGRAKSRRGTIIDIDDLPSEPMVDANIEPRAELRDVMAGLARLSVEQRAVLTLIAVEGMTYEEAAEALAIPVGTVMSRLSRAREGLRLYLETGSTVALRRIK
jgi:RNA polymerase sigma factor (sigma-70 family)